MTDVGGAVARPFCLDVLRLKRAASTGESDGKGLAVAKLLCQLIEKSRLMHGGDVMNRGCPRANGKEGEIECGAPRPAPAAGVTPAPSDSKCQRIAAPDSSGSTFPLGKGLGARLAAHAMSTDADVRGAIANLSRIEHHDDALVRRKHQRRLRRRSVRSGTVLSRILPALQIDRARLGGEIQRDDNVLLGCIAMEDEAIFGRALEDAIAALDQCWCRFAKLDQPPIEREHRVWIVQLARDVDGFEVSAWQPGVGAGGESAGWSVGDHCIGERQPSRPTGSSLRSAGIAASRIPISSP